MPIQTLDVLKVDLENGDKICFENAFVIHRVNESTRNLGGKKKS